MRRSSLFLTLLASACFTPREQDTQVRDERCVTCHGSASNEGDFLLKAAPPNDLSGSSALTSPGVGAHQRHLRASDTHGAIACDECHVVPTRVTDVGHDDTRGPAEVKFGVLATHDGGLTPEYNAFSRGCTNSYCHQAATVDWVNQRSADEACGTCHGLPPPAPHPQATQCSQCHSTVVDAQRHIINPALHVNGSIEVRDATCSSCHGSAPSGAPPTSLDGGSTPDSRGVGAHTAHLTASTTHRDVVCEDCHKVPQAVVSPGHLSGTVDVVFTTPASHGPRDGGSYDSTALTCTSWCHAPQVDAGSPSWTRQGTALGCTDCHGAPPPAPHPPATRCELCHLNVTADGGFIDKTLHINGVIDVRVATDCSTCHGSATNAAPPSDSHGGTATTLPSVGAHQRHLNPTFGRPVKCEECHSVPAAVSAPGHVDGVTQVSFSGVATAAGTVSMYDKATNTCTVYCHNADNLYDRATGGADPTPSWTKVDSSQVKCTSCHGFPPALPHQQRFDCVTCHKNFNGSGFSRPDLHIDGFGTFDLP